MADNELKGDDVPKKKSKKMLIIIVLVIVLLGAGGAAYYFMFMNAPPVSESSSQASDPDQQGQSETSSQDKAIYVAMPRPFQFNAPGVARERIVQIEVQLMVRGKDAEELAKRHIPMIEGSLLQVFSASNADDLVTDIGKTQLRNKATSQVRQVMSSLEKVPVVEEVLFTGFVIQ